MNFYEKQLARLKFRVWSELGASQIGLRAIAALKKGGCAVVSESTDLVIEGFPRSGNTFAYAAFRELGNVECAVAHHIHGAAQLIYAAKHGTPCMLLIREPLSACASLLVRQPYLQPRTVLRRYIDFHKKAWKVREHIFLVRFETVIENPTKTFRKLNNRYAVNFLADERDEAVERRINARVRAMDVADTSSHRDIALSVGLPDLARDEKKRIALNDLLATAAEQERQQALEWYERFLAIAS